jgi:hypothetical protein
MKDSTRLNPETKRLLEEIRSRRDYFADDDDETLLFRVLTEWLHYEGEEHVNDWIQSFF